MVDKISELSLDRIFWILSGGQIPVTPEKIIIYGLFFIGVVIFVNWMLSVTVIVVKPLLYAVLMLAILRPEFLRFLATDEVVLQMARSGRAMFMSFALGLTDILHNMFESIALKF